MPKILTIIKNDLNSVFIPSRYALICLAILFSLIVLLARTAYLQLVANPMLQHEADQRSLRTVVIPNTRGTILDRNGELIALSVPSRDIIANPEVILRSHPDFTSARWQYIADALNMTPVTLSGRIFTGAQRQFLYLSRHTEYGLAQHIEQLHLKGITSAYNRSRYYPLGEAAAPLVGTLDTDGRGLSGIELEFDHWLKGQPGSERYRKDAAGKIITIIDYTPPEPPPSLTLSIDRFIQYDMYSQLSHGILENHASSGAAVMIKIATGEILGMVSWPSGNPNNTGTLSPEGLRNIAINDSFEPGSTVKPLVVMEGLQRNLLKPNTVIDTNPYRVDGHLIHDVGHSQRLTLTGILQKSSNVGVSHIALAMPASAMVSTYSAFGLGKATGLGLAGESLGYLPRHRQRWADIERATFAFGYGMRVTPLQLARLYATLGAYGLYRPLSITKVTPPVSGVRVADSSTVKSVLHMMESDALPGGSGVRAAVPGYRLAIKTGTTEKLGKEGKYDGGYINYTAGVAPASDPQIALVIMIDNPTAGRHYGGSVVAPVFGRVMGDVLRHLHIAPDALLNPGGITTTAIVKPQVTSQKASLRLPGKSLISTAAGR